ncbi:hypothetical protein [Phyllobacterium sp. YR531]|uniref:hypothetical protein n=1 Tax=Phyllobacterium sp. YR531 TaxID=1144343 RepID=UPI0002F3DCCB|nr:hypothetical protein [Phyllobacterium sp. YR531]
MNDYAIAPDSNPAEEAPEKTRFDTGLTALVAPGRLSRVLLNSKRYETFSQGKGCFPVSI